MDVTERKRAENELRAGEARLRLFLENVSAPIAMLDREMRYLYVSRRWLTNYRIDERDITGLSHYDLFPEIPERWKEIHRRCLAGAVESCDEDPFERPDGSVQWVRWEVRPWMQVGGGVGGIIIFSEDITARKLAEQGLRDRERLLGIVTSSSRVGLIVVDSQYQYVFANEAYAEFLRLDVRNVIGRKVFDLLPERWPEIRIRLDRALAGERVTDEVRLTRLAGVDGPRWFRALYEPQADDTGRPTVVIVVVDLTELKQTEKRLREREELFRLLFENAAAGIAQVGLDGRFSEINNTWARLLGYTREEMLGLTFQHITHPDDLRADLDLVARLLAGEMRTYSVEKRCYCKGGAVIWVNLAVSLGRKGDGSPDYFIRVIQDITERKHAEAKERKLARIIEHSRDFIALADLDGRITFMNAGARRMIGVGEGEDAGQIHFTDYVPTQWREFFRGTVIRTPSEKGLWEGDMQLRHRQTGEIIDVSRSVFLIRDVLGEPLEFATVTRDITEWKRTEPALRLSESRYARAARGTGDGIWDVDLATGKDYRSPRWMELLGYAEGDLTCDLNSFYAILHPDDTERVNSAVKAHLEQNAPYDVELRLRTKAGDYRWIRARGMAERDEQGKPTHFAGSISDIADRKRDEEEIRRLNADLERRVKARTVELHEAQRLARVGSWGWDVGEDRVVWTAELYRIFGLDPGLPAPSFAEHATLYTPESWERLQSAVQETLRNGKPYDLDLEFRRRDGTTGALLVLGEVDRSDDGRVVRLRGTAQDITHARRAENIILIVDDEPMGRSALQALLTKEGYRLEFAPDGPTALKMALALTPDLVLLDVMMPGMDGYEVCPTAGRIKADPGQIEQVLINLAVNARDAMPPGGVLTIATMEAAGEGPSSDWVRVTVTDTGCGMSPEVLARAFEPFFTTKDVGKGTGLGLATVHGIVQQSGGRINVTSVLGRGTTFVIDFPRIEGSGPGVAGCPAFQPPKGDETILVAEDEADVLAIACASLESAGYTVISARDGEDALEASRGHEGRIDLLVTDVVMPRLGGRHLAETLREARPQTKVLYVSGYTDDAIIRGGVLEAEIAFLQKPYTPTTLLRKVREVLDR